MTSSSHVIFATACDSMFAVASVVFAFSLQFLSAKSIQREIWTVLIFLLSFFDSSSSVVSSISMHVGAGAVSKHEKESKQGSCFCVAGLRG